MEKHWGDFLRFSLCRCNSPSESPGRTVYHIIMPIQCSETARGVGRVASQVDWATGCKWEAGTFLGSRGVREVVKERLREEDNALSHCLLGLSEQWDVRALSLYTRQRSILLHQILECRIEYTTHMIYISKSPGFKFSSISVYFPPFKSHGICK